MKKAKYIIFLILLSSYLKGQDSVRARVIKTSEKVLIYEINKMRFVSYNCGCGLKKGDVFWIEKKRFDSLLNEAKPVRKKDLN